MRINENEKGFSWIEGLVAVLVVAVLGLVGWYTLGAHQKIAESPASTPSPSAAIPHGWIKTQQAGIAFYHPATWALTGSFEAEKRYVFTDSATTVQATLYATHPRIYYSANAPVLCQYDGTVWQHYIDELGGKPTKLPDEAPCDTLEPRAIAGNTAYMIAGGAEGQYRYFAAVAIQNGYVVLQDYRNDASYSSDHVGTAGDVKKSVETLAAQFAAAN